MEIKEFVLVTRNGLVNVNISLIRYNWELCNKVYQLYHKYKNRDFIIPLVLLTLAKTLGYFFWRLFSGQGIYQSDDSKWYLDYANGLMANFTVGLNMNDMLYLGYNMLLTLLLVIFKDPIVVVFIQCVTASLSVILVYKIAGMLFNRGTAIIASVFYCFMWDITLWSMYILSDSFFVSLLLLCVYYLLIALESNEKKYKVFFIVTALFMLVFRPTGIVMMVVMLVYVGIRFNVKSVVAFAKQHRLFIGGFLTVVAAGSIYIYTDHKLDPLIQSLQFTVKGILYNVYAKGWIYDKSTAFDYVFSPDYSINVNNSLILSFIVNNWDHIFMIYLRRASAFLGTWVWETNLQNIFGIISFAANLLPTALFVTGTIVAIINKQFRRASILWLIIFAAFIFCILLFIDAMYRYRFPAMPFIAIVAAYGVERIICGGRIIAKKYK